MKCFQRIEENWVFLCDINDINDISFGDIVCLTKTDGGVVITSVEHGPIRIGQ